MDTPSDASPGEPADLRDAVVRDDSGDLAALFDLLRDRRRSGGRAKLIDSGKLAIPDLERLAEAGMEIFSSDAVRTDAHGLVLIALAARKGSSSLSYFVHGPLGDSGGPAGISFDGVLELGRTGVRLAVSNGRVARDAATTRPAGRRLPEGRHPADPLSRRPGGRFARRALPRRHLAPPRRGRARSGGRVAGVRLRARRAFRGRRTRPPRFRYDRSRRVRGPLRVRSVHPLPYTPGRLPRSAPGAGGAGQGAPAAFERILSFLRVHVVGPGRVSDLNGLGVFEALPTTNRVFFNKKY